MGPFPGSGLTVTRRWAAANEERFLRFMRAMIRGHQWMMDPANRQRMVELIAESRRLRSEQAEEVYEEEVASMESLSLEEQVKAEAIQTLLDLRQEMGLTASPLPPVEKYVDASYYQRALESLGL